MTATDPDRQKAIQVTNGNDARFDAIVRSGANPAGVTDNVKKRGERGRAQTTLDLIDTCIEIIEACQPITVRGVCYKLFVAGLISSMEKKNTQKVSRILRDAREEGHIPWEYIVDESRQLERQPHWDNLQDYADTIERAYRRDFWADQKIRLIVISEKSTVGGILRPVLDRYGVPFLSVHGFNSATKVHELAEEIRADRRRHVFLYVGDWDPSGLYMSQLDMPERLRRYGAEDFSFTRIAIISKDTRGLPAFDARAKSKDPRYPWYVANYGYDAWELDAMDPEALRDRVESEVVAHIDHDAWDRHKVVENAQRETTKMIAKQMAAMNGGAA